MASIPVAEVVSATAIEPGQSEYSVIKPIEKLSSRKFAVLKQMGLVDGLAESVARASEVSARRYWIVDNSGSMGVQDGKKVHGKDKLVSCSRWEELCDSLNWHAAVASALDAHTEFRLLNFPKGGRSQNIVVGDGGNNDVALFELQSMMRAGPSGGTPLCRILHSVVDDITEIASDLRAVGRTVTVIIASDGEASDGDHREVEAALAPLAHLPCDVIVRLCTDEDHIVEYWDEIDNNLELDLDVLDDTLGEGDSIVKLNPWIGYGEALQRVREFGCAPKAFDLIDEKKLVLTEAREYIKNIFGEASADWPHPEVDAKGYLEELKSALSKTKPIFDPSQNKTVPWVDVKKLGKHVLNPTSAACIIV